MSETIDAQIKALQQKRREQNKVESRTNLVKVATNKNSSIEDLLSACYTFVATHRLAGSPRRKKVAEPAE